MAADPKDTTVTEENTETAAEAAAEVETVASAPTSPAQKLSAEALIKAFETEQMKSDLPEIYVGDTARDLRSEPPKLGVVLDALACHDASRQRPDDEFAACKIETIEDLVSSLAGDRYRASSSEIESAA